MKWLTIKNTQMGFPALMQAVLNALHFLLAGRNIDNDVAKLLSGLNVSIGLNDAGKR